MSLYIDIEKRLGSFTLEVQLEAGNEILALLGASGCGKSMTLKCIAGIEKPDRGRIVLDGRVLFDSAGKINLPPQKRKTGYLFQNYALFPNMTVEENIASGIALPRSSKAPIIAEKIKAFYLDGLEGRYPSQISGGQQQRVALARIMASSPDILMLDEPFSALDSYLRWQLEQEMSGVLQSFGGTTLFVSHNRDEVYRICSRIAVLSQGKLEALSEKWSLFDDPQTVSASLLTGCKNIAGAKKISPTRIDIPEWGLQLETGRAVPDGTAFAGIRAHYFQFASPEEENAFPFEIVRQIEDTFSMILMIRIAGSDPSQKPIRWEIGKEDWKSCPQNVRYARIAPPKILLFDR